MKSSSQDWGVMLPDVAMEMAPDKKSSYEQLVAPVAPVAPGTDTAPAIEDYDAFMEAAIEAGLSPSDVFENALMVESDPTEYTMLEGQNYASIRVGEGTVNIYRTLSGVAVHIYIDGEQSMVAEAFAPFTGAH